MSGSCSSCAISLLGELSPNVHGKELNSREKHNTMSCDKCNVIIKVCVNAPKSGCFAVLNLYCVR